MPKEVTVPDGALVYTLSEAAVAARVSKSSIERAIRSGALPSVKRVGRRVILPEVLRSWARGEAVPTAVDNAGPKAVPVAARVVVEVAPKVVSEAKPGVAERCPKCGIMLLFGRSHRCEPVGA